FVGQQSITIIGSQDWLDVCESNIVFIANIPIGYPKTDFVSHFETYGKVLSTKFVDRTGVSFAFIHFDSGLQISYDLVLSYYKSFCTKISDLSQYFGEDSTLFEDIGNTSIAFGKREIVKQIEDHFWSSDLSLVAAKDSDCQSADMSSTGINPFEDMHQIYGTLYLGCFEATQDRQALIDCGIRGILTVMCAPVPPFERYRDFKYHYIEADDVTDQDLLTRFVDAYDIIGTYTRAKTGVLVHCGAGISRSATIVVSYLMRELRMTLKESMAFVRTKRPIIRPNDGFQRQLSLYEWMGCRLDGNDRRFRQYLLKMFVPSNCRQLSQYFERLLYVENSTANLRLGPKFVCKHCHQKLFHEIHVLKSTDSTTDWTCGDLFIEPQIWMSNAIQSLAKSVAIIKCQNCVKTVAKCLRNQEVCNCRHHQNVHFLKIKLYDQKWIKEM
ncbi:unnamed protein product, partial [Medioppia subpectinata]